VKPYLRVWKVLSLLCIFALASLMIHAPLIMTVDATQGTWLIENETVVIENNHLVQEGDIVIRGTGQLSLVNSSLTIVQLLSWQFQIRVEDSGMFSIEDSDLHSKYPFKIECNGQSEINLTSSSSPNAMIITNDNSFIFCDDSNLRGIMTNEQSQATVNSCILRTAGSSDDSLVDINSSELGSVGINDDSQTNITASQIGPVVVESGKPTILKDCTADALRGWGESKIAVSGCTLGDYRYSDYVEASFSNSSIGDLDATGIQPLILNQIVIESAILRGSANVTMNQCSVGTLEVYLNSAITLWNSTCDNFFSTQYADVNILGTPSAESYLGDCLITQICTATITWSNFEYLEIAHSSTAQVNDSYAGYFNTWRYTACLVDIWRCRFHEFRVSGSVATMHDSSVEIWSNIGVGANLSAISCDFGLDLTFYDTSVGYLENCTMNPLRPQYESQVVIRNCTATVSVFDYADRVRTVDSVPAGDISYWSSYESNAFLNVQWNLTVYNSILAGWNLRFWHEADYTILNSTLKKVEVKSQCSVVIEDSSIEELWATNGETEVFRSKLTAIGIQTIARLTLNECVCDAIWHYNDATSMHFNSTFDRFYSYNQAESHLYNCVIRSVGPSGNSHIFLENCTMRYLDAFQYAIVEISNSEVEDRLASHDFTITSITNSTIIILAGYHSSQIDVSTSNISDIRLYHSSDVVIRDSVLISIYCVETSHLSVLGNLSSTTSCSIYNSAQVLRELNIIVENQAGAPIQSATVEVYDSLGNLVVSGMSNSLGVCELTLVFEIAGLGFLSTFTAVASLDGTNTTIMFMTTTPQPLVIVLDTSEPFYTSYIYSGNDRSEEFRTKDMLEDEGDSFFANQDIAILSTYDFVIGILSLVSLSLFIVRDDAKRSILRLNLAKQHREVKK